MTKIAGVIFAGGKARRLSGVDKATLKVGHRTCFERVSNSFFRNVDQLAISLPYDQLNQAAQTYNKGHIYPIAPDWPSDEKTPAVAFAVLGSLAWAFEEGFDAIITSPVDTPFLTSDCLGRLRSGFKEGQSSVCRVGEDLHGLNALWSVKALETLKHAILKTQTYKISKLHEILSSKIIDFPQHEDYNFWNINTPESLEAAQKRAKNN